MRAETVDEHVPASRPEIGNRCGFQERLVEHDFRLKLEDSEQRREDAGKEGEEEIYGPNFDVEDERPPPQLHQGWQRRRVRQAAGLKHVSNRCAGRKSCHGDHDIKYLFSP